MNYVIAAQENCKSCHGYGTVTEYHPWGSTIAGEDLTCDCVLEQLPEDFDDIHDTIEVISTGWKGGDGPEFEYEDYADLWEE